MTEKSLNQALLKQPNHYQLKIISKIRRKQNSGNKSNTHRFIQNSTSDSREEGKATDQNYFKTYDKIFARETQIYTTNKSYTLIKNWSQSTLY